jgi:hypothetical protein
MIDKIATVISLFMWFAFAVTSLIYIYNKGLKCIEGWWANHG